jgi:hypothetical protein
VQFDIETGVQIHQSQIEAEDQAVRDDLAR